MGHHQRLIDVELAERLPPEADIGAAYAAAARAFATSP
jgi:hypothetical protein